MSKASTAKARIESQIIDSLGSTATRYPFSSESLNKWGDSTPVYGGTGGLLMPVVMPVVFQAGATESVTCVPYNAIFKRNSFQAFGDLQEGDVVMVFKDGQTLNQKDKIVYGSEDYFVRQIENFPLQDVNLVKVVLLSKDL
jgi:hypothetical protein